MKDTLTTQETLLNVYNDMCQDASLLPQGSKDLILNSVITKCSKYPADFIRTLSLPRLYEIAKLPVCPDPRWFTLFEFNWFKNQGVSKYPTGFFNISFTNDDIFEMYKNEWKIRDWTLWTSQEVQFWKGQFKLRCTTDPHELIDTYERFKLYNLITGVWPCGFRSTAFTSEQGMGESEYNYWVNKFMTEKTYGTDDDRNVIYNFLEEQGKTAEGVYTGSEILKVAYGQRTPWSPRPADNRPSWLPAPERELWWNMLWKKRPIYPYDIYIHRFSLFNDALIINAIMTQNYTAYDRVKDVSTWNTATTDYWSNEYGKVCNGSRTTDKQLMYDTVMRIRSCGGGAPTETNSDYVKSKCGSTLYSDQLFNTYTYTDEHKTTAATLIRNNNGSCTKPLFLTTGEQMYWKDRARVKCGDVPMTNDEAYAMVVGSCKTNAPPWSESDFNYWVNEATKICDIVTNKWTQDEVYKVITENKCILRPVSRWDPDGKDRGYWINIARSLCPFVDTSFTNEYIYDVVKNRVCTQRPYGIWNDGEREWWKSKAINNCGPVCTTDDAIISSMANGTCTVPTTITSCHMNYLNSMCPRNTELTSERLEMKTPEWFFDIFTTKKCPVENPSSWTKDERDYFVNLFKQRFPDVAHVNLDGIVDTYTNQQIYDSLKNNVLSPGIKDSSKLQWYRDKYKGYCGKLPNYIGDSALQGLSIDQMWYQLINGWCGSGIGITYDVTQYTSAEMNEFKNKYATKCDVPLDFFYQDSRWNTQALINPLISGSQGFCELAAEHKPGRWTDKEFNWWKNVAALKCPGFSRPAKLLDVYSQSEVYDIVKGLDCPDYYPTTDAQFGVWNDYLKQICPNLGVDARSLSRGDYDTLRTGSCPYGVIADSCVNDSNCVNSVLDGRIQQDLTKYFIHFAHVSIKSSATGGGCMYIEDSAINIILADALKTFKTFYMVFNYEDNKSIREWGYIGDSFDGPVQDIITESREYMAQGYVPWVNYQNRDIVPMNSQLFTFNAETALFTDNEIVIPFGPSKIDGKSIVFLPDTKLSILPFTTNYTMYTEFLSKYATLQSYSVAPNRTGTTFTGVLSTSVTGDVSYTKEEDTLYIIPEIVGGIAAFSATLSFLYLYRTRPKAPILTKDGVLKVPNPSHILDANGRPGPASSSIPMIDIKPPMALDDFIRYPKIDPKNPSKGSFVPILDDPAKFDKMHPPGTHNLTQDEIREYKRISLSLASSSASDADLAKLSDFDERLASSRSFVSLTSLANLDTDITARETITSNGSLSIGPDGVTLKLPIVHDYSITNPGMTVEQRRAQIQSRGSGLPYTVGDIAGRSITSSGTNQAIRYKDGQTRVTGPIGNRRIMRPIPRASRELSGSGSVQNTPIPQAVTESIRTTARLSLSSSQEVVINELNRLKKVKDSRAKKSSTYTQRAKGYTSQTISSRADRAAGFATIALILSGIFTQTGTF
jgi:hypothetical protein